MSSPAGPEPEHHDGNEAWFAPGLAANALTPPAPVILRSTDTQPPPGTVVRDDLGRTWELSDEDEGGMWWRTDADDDPESWTKIAGNYGPVTVLEWGEAEP